MALLAGLLLVVAVSLGGVSWKGFQRRSVQRAVAARWSLMFILLWCAVVAYLQLVYYPLPPENHHTDKLLVLNGVLLLWSTAFILVPSRLETILASRPYGWIRVILVNAFIFLVTAEPVLRLVDPILARHGLFGDKQTPAFLRPNAPVRGVIGFSNSQGFRDRERSMERSSGVPRLVALGDSFTYGAGVDYEDTFVTILEDAAQASFPGLEVINLGVPGWSPNEEITLMKVYGARLVPDVVLLNFFIGNDIMRKRGYDEEEAVVVAGQSFYVHRNGNWFHDTFGPVRWHLYHNLRYLQRVGAARIAQKSEPSPRRNDLEFDPLFTDDQYLRYIEEYRGAQRGVLESRYPSAGAPLETDSQCPARIR